MILRKTPKSVCHNGPTPVAPLTGFLTGSPTTISTFTDINQGLNEYNRRGDQIYIDKIKFRAYVNSNLSNDAVRLTVLRQPRSGFPPAPINLSAVWQNFFAGGAGVVSGFQDDQPCSVLFDKVYTLGNGGSGVPECRFIEFTLNFSKRPLKVVYLDGSATGTSFNTVMGDIELVATSVGLGNVFMISTYDVYFHEK